MRALVLGQFASLAGSSSHIIAGFRLRMPSYSLHAVAASLQLITSSAESDACTVEFTTHHTNLRSCK